MSKSKKETKAPIFSGGEDKATKVKMAIAKMDSLFGTGTVRLLGDAKVPNIPRSDSGSHYLNDILGGGYPKGRVIEAYGPESSGKTTVALHAIAEVQREGGVALFVDAEHALDLKYAAALGVDVENLILAQPDTGEDAFQIIEFFLRSGIVDIYVLDSVAALMPKAEFEGDIGDNHMGLLARLMSQSLRKISNLTYRSGAIGIFLNQIRLKIGVMFGNPETTPGGEALKFYASVRLDIRAKEIIKDKEGEASSRKTRIKVIKSKVSPPFREVEVDIEFGKGISRSGEIVDIGSDIGVIAKNGSYYTFRSESGEEFKAQGRDNAKKLLEGNSELMSYLDQMVASMFTPQVVDVVIEEPELGEMPEELEATPEVRSE